MDSITDKQQFTFKRVSLRSIFSLFLLRAFNRDDKSTHFAIYARKKIIIFIFPILKTKTFAYYCGMMMTVAAEKIKQRPSDLK